LAGAGFSAGRPALPHQLAGGGGSGGVCEDAAILD
jgi:hypothetical protein